MNTWKKTGQGQYRNDVGDLIYRVFAGEMVKTDYLSGMQYVHLLPGWFVIPHGKHRPRRTRYKTLKEAKDSLW